MPPTVAASSWRAAFDFVPERSPVPITDRTGSPPRHAARARRPRDRRPLPLPSRSAAAEEIGGSRPVERCRRITRPPATVPVPESSLAPSRPAGVDPVRTPGSAAADEVAPGRTAQEGSIATRPGARSPCHRPRSPPARPPGIDPAPRPPETAAAEKVRQEPPVGATREDGPSPAVRATKVAFVARAVFGIGRLGEPAGAAVSEAVAFGRARTERGGSPSRATPRRLAVRTRSLGTTNESRGSPFDRAVSTRDRPSRRDGSAASVRRASSRSSSVRPENRLAAVTHALRVHPLLRRWTNRVFAPP